MKHLLVTLFLFISFLGFGQQVNVPDPKEFSVSTSGQSASGFSLSGFNSTATLLCAVGLPVAPAGTTFYFSTTSGVTASTGYSMSGNKTRLTFTGTQTNINNVLASMKINTTGTAGNIQISVSATVNPTGYYYLPTNGHFYKPVAGFTGVSGFSGTSVTAYNNLKTYCTQQSFKGQTGYLMTITSADEDNFVYLNVPQSNIIFALTDNVTEGTFKIDAGPEAGTVVRIGATNQQGQYNNWAGGEPNNWGSGEDYVVTKWNGSQWNDYGPEATPFPGGIGGYVIEFGTWSNPDDQTFTEFYNNSVVNTNGPNLNLVGQFNFNFGNNVDETKFLGTIFKRNNSTSAWTGNTYKTLNGLGRVTLSEQLDTIKIFNGQQYKATTVGGNVEWCVLYDYDNANSRHRVLIDKREFPSGTSPNAVSRLQLFDLYDGEITFYAEDAYWAQYYIYTNTPITTSNSNYSSYIRDANGYYALRAEFTFAQLGEYKQHKFQFQDYDSVQLKTLYNSIVTVSDVYLAFKELAEAGGIFGGGSGTQFTYGMQFKNADIDDNGVFNEADCFRLLQNLTGAKSLMDNYTLDNTMKIILDSTYGTIGKSNWQQFPSYLGKDYGFSLLDGKINYTYNLAVTWKGDVNLSHSATPPSNGITTMSANFGEKTMSAINQMNTIIITQLSGDSLYVELNFNPGDNNIVGTQFQLNYDNSLLKYNKTEYIVNGSPTNYSANNGTFINVGSLNTDGSQITSATYKVLFTTIQKIDGSLGLVSVGNSEAVNKDGKSLAVKIK